MYLFVLVHIYECTCLCSFLFINVLVCAVSLLPVCLFVQFPALMWPPQLIGREQPIIYLSCLSMYLFVQFHFTIVLVCAISLFTSVIVCTVFCLPMCLFVQFHCLPVCLFVQFLVYQCACSCSFTLPVCLCVQFHFTSVLVCAVYVWGLWKTLLPGFQPANTRENSHRGPAIRVSVWWLQQEVCPVHQPQVSHSHPCQGQVSGSHFVYSFGFMMFFPAKYIIVGLPWIELVQYNTLFHSLFILSLDNFTFGFYFVV